MELARVARGCLVVRPAGSMPTAFVDAVENARCLKLDNTADRCEIALIDGRHMSLSFHLFSTEELHTASATTSTLKIYAAATFSTAVSHRIVAGTRPTCHLAAASWVLSPQWRKHIPETRISSSGPCICCWSADQRAGRGAGFASGLTFIKVPGLRKAA